MAAQTQTTVGSSGQPTVINGSRIELNDDTFLKQVEARALVVASGFFYTGWDNFRHAAINYNGLQYTANQANPSQLLGNYYNHPVSMMHMVINRSTGQVEVVGGYPVQVHNNAAQLLAGINSRFDDNYIHIIVSRAKSIDFTAESDLKDRMLSLGASREALEWVRQEVAIDPVDSTHGNRWAFGYALIGIPGLGAGNGLEATQEFYDSEIDTYGLPVITTILLKGFGTGSDHYNRYFTPSGLQNNSLIQDDGDLWAARGIEAGAGSHTNNNGGISIGSNAVASGQYAAAFGKNTMAAPEMSFVAGSNVKLDAAYAGPGAVAFGQYNKAGAVDQGDPRKPIFVVGSGNSGARKDTFVIYSDGTYQLGEQNGNEASFRQDWVWSDDISGGGNRSTTFEGAISLGDGHIENVNGDAGDPYDGGSMVEDNKTRGVYFNVSNIKPSSVVNGEAFYPLHAGARIYSTNKNPVAGDGYPMTALILEAANSWNGYSENQLVLRSNGRVGIGTDEPSARLHISGNARISGPIAISGGNPAPNRVLTSIDSAGNAEWRTLNLNNISGSWSTAQISQIEPFVIRGSGNERFNVSELVKIGSNNYSNSTGRGLTLTILSRVDHSRIVPSPSSSPVYDVFASNSECERLASALDALDSTQIGILTSRDAWEGQAKLSDRLKMAFIRLGLYKIASVEASDPAYRQPYAAIFEGVEPGGAPTKAVESLVQWAGNLGPNTPNPAQALAEIRGFLIDGSIVATGSGSSNVLTNFDGSEPAVVVDHEGYVSSMKVRKQGDISMGAFSN